ncbi:cytochrome P450 704C1-like isoform X3 [Lycium barbarum]|uniref:cytochrome P450 704C1-like isoform X3 n=1 Tax=Lycium barbarum TaxID=112863 RepID=UPI00293ECFDD|nr:cytochrome P450 704C1-like isoform X3 [Lycium barbarum]
MNPISIVATFPSICLSFLILIVYFINKLGEKKKGKKRYHPIADSTTKQLINFHRIHDHMADLAAIYKTYRLESPFRREIYTSDPANIEYILKTNFDNYGKGDYHHDILKDFYGDGMFTVDGEKWKEQRKVSSPEFSKRVIREVNSLIFTNNALKLANILDQSANSKDTVDIQEGANKFIKALDDASEMSLLRYIDLFWKIKKAINIGSEAKLKKSLEIIDEYMYKLISSKAEQLSQDLDSSQKGENILSRFWHYSSTNPKYLRDILINFMGGGKDTTGTTLSWFILMLCRYPVVQEKLAEEIKEATNMKGSTTISDFAANLKEEAIDKMPYLHAVLSETIRLYPAIPVNAKVCLEDDVFPDGFNVKKGDMVAYPPYAMGRMKYLWGNDAQEFRPERWLDENGSFKQESPFKFTAFQAGPRICIGKEFAYRSMKITAAVLMRFFVFKLSDESEPVNYKTMLQLHIDRGLHVRAFHRINHY